MSGTKGKSDMNMSEDLGKFGTRFKYQGHLIQLTDRGISVRAYVDEKPIDGFYNDPTDAYLAAREFIHSLESK